MFPWNIAKSAEAVFSRWAVKRLCKFLLKKKLGKFILGDIDLEQLDVQLRDGSIMLSDLALNVDYLNEKFNASLLIKEGSIGSLLVKMPWRSKGCQVELDELEIILAPRLESNTSTANGASTSTQEASHGMHHELGKLGNDLMENAAKSASVDVHEGVKTVAKIVKWFLTSFHVKIKKLIVAFDPYLDKEQHEAGTCSSLVFRLSEIECGTCVSEDPILNNDTRADNFLGISRLTNFVKFHGAVLELLQMDEDDNKTHESNTSNTVTPIMTGNGGGFSGSLNLSIPWKNGSLDIRKVDADLCIDPIEVRLQPTIIKWFLCSWVTCKSLDLDCGNSISHFDSPTPISAARPTDKVTSHGRLSSSSGQEPVTKTTLSGLQFIPDWVPSSFSKKDDVGEVDFGASVDQFFECFDGMRSYQSALGSSGMWNWTSSVFTAITAASSLASGSLDFPSEQQHVQTSFKVSFSGVALVLLFQDEDNEKDYCTNSHYLGAECRNIFASVQVCPREMRLGGEVHNIVITDYFYKGSNISAPNIKSETSLIRNFQAAVQSALPLFALSERNADLHQSDIITDGFLSRNKDFSIKTVLVRAPGATQFQLTIKSQSSDGSFAGVKSFSLSLPPIIFWLNFHLIKMLANLFEEISESVFEIKDKKNRVASSGPCTTTSFLTESLQGSISIPDARAILCFSFEKERENLCNLFEEQFFVLDFSSPKTLNKGRFEDRNPGDVCFASAACSICFSVGDVSIYLVTSDHKDFKTNSCDLRGKFSACKILYTSNCMGHQLSTISMLWYDGPVSGPWLLERAKFLATMEESMQTNKFVGKGHEFAAVTTAKDMEDIYSQTRKEITKGSAFCLHVHLLPVTIDLGSSQYSNLHYLLDQIKSWLSCIAGDTTDEREKSAGRQSSVILECDTVEILVRPEAKEDIKGSLQIELPGSWHCLKMRIQKVNLLSVSDIGGIHGADFFWLAHGEGKLWGSVTGVPDKELLLISCSNSMMKRGNGGGSNALSSRLAGLDIVHLRDPEISHGYLSISLRCSTFVAIGGRVDWLNAVSSFFILPSGETEHVFDDNQLERDSSPSSGSSFILNLVDVGLIYEPHFKNSELLEGTGASWIACLLAASSFNLSNTAVADSVSNDYRIRVQDLGLLLSMVSVPNRLGGTYSVEYLRETGYIKVAQEALVEASLRTNSENGLLWELECSESHLFIETCNDTTFGLIRLVVQLQQLFAPDLEESAVHLQTRWNNIQQAHATNDFDARSEISSSGSSSQMQNSSLDAKIESSVVGLMDEINEEAFRFDANPTGQFDSLESQYYHTSSDESFHREACRLVHETPEILSSDQFICGSSSEIVPESSQTLLLDRDYLPELKENYCLSELRPWSELSLGRESSGRQSILEEADTKRGNAGWYDNDSVRIVEDHVSETTVHNAEERVLDDESLHSDSAKFDNLGNSVGRVFLKNTNMRWRMYSGTDWHDSENKSNASRNIKGRDSTVCLELELSGMQCQYDVFPVGGMLVSKLSLLVRDFYLYDRSKDAPWKLVLGYYNSKDHPRESSSNAFKVDLEAIRPDPQTPLEEYRLRIAVLPMLLHLHQSQVDFLISFFGADSSDKPPVCPDDSAASMLSPGNSDNLAGRNIMDEALLPYFQKFDIWPVTVRVDYSPHHVDLAALRGGKYAELVNLVPWKGVELQLKHVHSAGIYGWGNVCETILGEWLEDISQNQIHKLLRGIPTIRSLFALYAGASKLVSSPVESYRRDRRVLKGVQRGTIAFLRSISLEAVGLGVHLAAGAHDILLRAEYVLASSPSRSQPQGKTKANVRHNQPKNARQGIQQAYESISDGLGKSASALVRTPLKKYQRGASAGSALVTAVQGVPTAALAPASACARAVHNTLVGIRNSLDPEHKKESIEKYSGPDEPRNQK